MGTVRSYNHIQKYKSIEKLIESGKCNIPEDFLKRYTLSRDLFNIFIDKIDIKDMNMKSSDYDKKKLFDFLTKECSMNEKRISKTLEKFDS